VVPTTIFWSVFGATPALWSDPNNWTDNYGIHRVPTVQDDVLADSDTPMIVDVAAKVRSFAVVYETVTVNAPLTVWQNLFAAQAAFNLSASMTVLAGEVDHTTVTGGRFVCGPTETISGLKPSYAPTRHLARANCGTTEH
jgi:hypothetical protein